MDKLKVGWSSNYSLRRISSPLLSHTLFHKTVTYSKATFTSVHSQLELKGQPLTSPASLTSYNMAKHTLKNKALAN